MQATSTSLAPLPDDVARILVVVAHPDDMEFGGAAAVARWTAAGTHVVYLLLTSGEAGIDGLDPAESGPLREKEQLASCEAVGVSDVEFARLPDGVLEYGVPLRARIARTVRRVQPDVVVTTNFRDTWPGGGLNQADHIASGRAVLDAVRDAGNRWIFREQLVDGVGPWDGVRQVWAASSPRAAHGVDTTTTFGAGVESLLAHQAYIEGLGWEDFDPAEFLAQGSRAAGTLLGTEHAASFEVFDLGFGGADDEEAEGGDS